MGLTWSEFDQKAVAWVHALRSDWGDEGQIVAFGDRRAPDEVWARLEVSPHPSPLLGTPCWLYRGPVNGRGYATLRLDGKSHGAHRFMFERFVGPIGTGRQVDHICRVRACANPHHLRSVTPKENTAAGLSAARATCRRGHLYSEFGVYDGTQRGEPKRVCRLCKRESRNRAAARRRAREKGVPFHGIQYKPDKFRCPSGHTLTPDNRLPREYRKGNLACLRCSRERSRKRMREKYSTPEGREQWRAYMREYKRRKRMESAGEATK